MLANITASQCLVVRMAQLQAAGKMTDAHAAVSKAFTTSKCRETVAWARELLGGNGIAAEYNVGRFFADAEALYSYEGTYQMQNLIIGKAITGFSAFIYTVTSFRTRDPAAPTEVKNGEKESNAC